MHAQEKTSETSWNSVFRWDQSYIVCVLNCSIAILNCSCRQCSSGRQQCLQLDLRSHCLEVPRQCYTRSTVCFAMNTFQTAAMLCEQRLNDKVSFLESDCRLVSMTFALSVYGAKEALQSPEAENQRHHQALLHGCQETRTLCQPVQPRPDI